MRIKLLLLSLAIVLMSFVSFSKFIFKNNKPTKITWETLQDITFEKRWYEEEATYMLCPLFGTKITKLNGQEVIIKGYIFPLDPSSNLFVLSNEPFRENFLTAGGKDSQYFLGLKFKQTNRKFKANQKLSFKGILRLNDDNIYELNYILENVEIDGE
jgi:hypothetical protein